MSADNVARYVTASGLKRSYLAHPTALAGRARGEECLVAADTVELARSFLQRAKGLLFRGGIARTHALVLYKTYSIHMFMMVFTIDVIFLDSERRVRALFPHRRPSATRRMRTLRDSFAHELSALDWTVLPCTGRQLWLRWSR